MSEKYICLRYFFVPLENDLFVTPLEKLIKEKMVIDRFLVNSDYITKKGKKYAVRNITNKNSLYFGKLSKFKLEERHILNSDDIDDVLIDDWPYINFCIDPNPDKQVMVISSNNDITTYIDALCNDLSEIATALFIADGYKISFNPINEKRAFWDIINNSDYVFALTFRLNSPNIFGSSSNANESLKELQSVFNNDVTTITVKNKKGLLNVTEKNSDTYRDYADRGGGSWKIIYKKKKGKRRGYDTAKHAMRISLTISTETSTVEDVLKEAYDQFKGNI